MRAPRFSKIVFAFLLILPFLALPAHATEQTQRALSFISKLGNSAIGILADKSIPQEEASRRFRAMLHDDFDLNLLGKFALGPTHWRALNPQQKQEYMKLFERLVVDIYSDRFKTYNGETFKAGTAHAESATDSYVTSFIVSPGGGQPIQVDWRVRDYGDRRQVIDVIVEGVSMSITKRSEFASAIQQQGGDYSAFLELLRAKVNSGDTTVQDGDSGK
ncbi:MAG: ABC transporter substrate-binding protein [Proteobacteria bacterium]|nr:ABC transporter substrate-binding protein [Pseudomonadota bacterium]